MTKNFLLLCCIILIVPGIMDAQDTLSRKEIKKQQSNFLLPGRPWTIEIPLWIPGYVGSFGYGDVEIDGDYGVDPIYPVHPTEPPDGIFPRLFTDEWYLKFFFMGRATYENNRIILQTDALTGSVGESVKFNYNSREFVEAHYRSSSIRLFGGYEVINVVSKKEKFRYELFAYLGVRMHFNKIYVELANSTSLLDISPSWAEPIIGLQNQFTWKRWFVVLQGDFGGYFINSKYSTHLSAFVNYKLGLLTSMKLGWNHLALNQEGTLLNQDYHVKATFSGPSLGVSFNF